LRWRQPKIFNFQSFNDYLGSPDFFTFIKDEFISGKKPDENLPALKELVEKASINSNY